MIETTAPGLHDAILLGASIAGVYLVVALLQLAQLKRHTLPMRSPREPSLGLQHTIDKGRTETKAGADDERSFAMHLRRTNVEADLQRLQHEVQILRDELSATKAEIQALQPQRSQSNAPPLYNEAMVLAKRGINATAIAARCGISMGEAELVTALTRIPQELDLTAEDKKTANKEPNERHHLHGFRPAA